MNLKLPFLFAIVISLSVCFYVTFSWRMFNSNNVAALRNPLSPRITTHYTTGELQIKKKEVSWINRTCFKYQIPTDVDMLSASLMVWKSSENLSCRKMYLNFVSIYQVREKMTEITISDTFLTKVSKWLQGNKELIASTKKQTLVFIDNLYTQESVVFNPVRSRRPGVAGGDSSKILERIVNTTEKDCDFCKFKEFTATDSFGYLESKHAVIVSNTFKIDKFHGMILLKHHNPSKFSLVEFLDAMNLASKWYKKVTALAPDHKYRHMYWDVYGRASASQVHPHIHILLGDNAYYAKWNRLFVSASNFAKNVPGSNYWNRVIEAHNSLDLIEQFGEATALAYLTPQKEFTVFVICQRPNLDFFKLVYFVYRGFIDDLKFYSYSSGFVFPKMDSNGMENDELPALFSIIYRGSLGASVSDISSFDLFGTPYVKTSPFKVIKAIRYSVQRRKQEESSSEEFSFE